MKVIEPGHFYEMEMHSRSGDASDYRIPFMQKTQNPETLDLEITRDGVTNEEVLAVLIDRLQYLQGIVPCAENAAALSHLEAALSALNARTADRTERGVEGTEQA